MIVIKTPTEDGKGFTLASEEHVPDLKKILVATPYKAMSVVEPEGDLSDEIIRLKIELNNVKSQLKASEELNAEIMNADYKRDNPEVTELKKKLANAKVLADDAIKKKDEEHLQEVKIINKELDRLTLQVNYLMQYKKFYLKVKDAIAPALESLMFKVLCNDHDGYGRDYRGLEKVFLEEVSKLSND